MYAPVCNYWPESATNGKEAIEVRHLLSHALGVSGGTCRSRRGYLRLGAVDRPAGRPGAVVEPGTASGYRGSLIIADQRRRATISYMMNRMAPGIIGSPRSESYVRAVYGCLS